MPYPIERLTVQFYTLFYPHFQRKLQGDLLKYLAILVNEAEHDKLRQIAPSKICIILQFIHVQRWDPITVFLFIQSNSDF